MGMNTKNVVIMVEHEIGSSHIYSHGLTKNPTKVLKQNKVRLWRLLNSMLRHLCLIWLAKRPMKFYCCGLFCRHQEM